MAPAAPDKRIALAAVAGAHGIKGEVRLKLFADSAASLDGHELYVGGARAAARGPRRARTPPRASKGSTTAPPPRPARLTG